MKNKNIEELYQNSKTNKPPVSLDNFILAQARNSCDDKKIVHNKPHRNRWMLSLSSVAVVVFSFSIILNLQHENELNPMQPNLVQKSKQVQQIPKRIQAQNKLEEQITTDAVKVLVETESNFTPQVVTKQEVVSDGVQAETTLVDTIDEKPETSIGNSQIHLSKTKAKEKINELSGPLMALPEAKTEANTEPNKVRKNQNSQSVNNEILHISESKQALDSQSLEIEELGAVAGFPAKSPSPKPLARTVAKKKNSRSRKEKYNADPVDSQLLLIQQLEQLDALIDESKIIQAKQLLQQLQKSYPDYDFTQYNLILGKV